MTENATGQTWNRVRAELQRQHAVTWTGPAGTFRQTTDLTKPLRDIYTALAIEPPQKILALDPAPRPPDLREHQNLVTRPVTGLYRSCTSKPIFRSLGGQSSAEPRNAARASGPLGRFTTSAVGLAAALLPSASRDRYTEEWKSDLCHLLRRERVRFLAGMLSSAVRLAVVLRQPALRDRR